MALTLVVAAFAVAAPAALASNDSSATPTPLSYGSPEQINTSAYTVQPGEQNTTAPFTQQCDSGHNVGAARTAWYSIKDAVGTVNVTTGGSDFDTSLFVYEGSPGGRVVSCSDDSDTDVQALTSFDATAGP